MVYEMTAFRSPASAMTWMTLSDCVRDPPSSVIKSWLHYLRRYLQKILNVQRSLKEPINSIIKTV